jgi:hypothetical protein
MIDRDNCTPAGLAAQAVKKMISPQSFSTGTRSWCKKDTDKSGFSSCSPLHKTQNLDRVLNPVKAVQT